MKKIFCFLSILAFGISSAFSQKDVTYTPQQSYVRYTGTSNAGTLPRPSVELAIGLQLYTFKGNMYVPAYNVTESLDPNPSIYFLYSLLVSCNIPLKQIRENLYLGLNPNIGLGYSYGSQSFGGDVPIYLTLKYGAASYRGCQKPFGIGAGVGGMVSGLITYLGDVDGDVISYHTGYVTPSVMAEVSFDVGYGNIYQIRTDFMPVSINKNTALYQGSVNQVNVRIIRTF